MGWRGILAGALGLAALERLVSHPAAAGRTGGLLASVGDMVRHFLSPTWPAFGNKAAPAPTTTPTKA